MSQDPVDHAEYFRTLSDDTLAEQLALGREDFTPEAWRCLELEAAMRGVQAAGASPAPSSVGVAPFRRTPTWLNWFLVLRVLGMGVLVVLLAFAWALPDASNGQLPWLTLFDAVIVALNLWGMRLAVRRDPRAPGFWRAYLIAIMVLIVLGGLVLNHGSAELFKDALQLFWSFFWLRFWWPSPELDAVFPPASVPTAAEASTTYPL